MLLIDALNINEGGGTILLEYFVQRLREEQLTFQVLIRKNRAEYLQPAERIEPNYGRFTWLARKKIIATAVQKTKPQSLFCFGSIPPPLKCNDIFTVTFFQNLHLLRSLDRLKYSAKNHLRYGISSHLIHKFLRNCDHWIFQSNFVRENFIREYQADPQACSAIPFYDDQSLPSSEATYQNSASADRFIYISHATPHKNHFRLLDAWELLLKKDLRPTLILTIGNHREDLLNRIEQLRTQGAKIENLGHISKQQALDETRKCNFVVFPTLLETLGLGMVEGALAGCKVLASELPFVDEIITPSATFDPLDPNSIAATVEAALQNQLPDTEILVQNQIDQLIELFQAHENKSSLATST